MNRYINISIAVLSMSSVVGTAVLPNDPIHAPYDDAMSVLTTAVGSTNGHFSSPGSVQDTITGSEIQITPQAPIYDSLSLKS